MTDLYSKPLPMGEFFDRVADQYDEVHTSHIDKGEEFYLAIAEPVAPTKAPIRVLSLGAGTGLDLVGIAVRAPNAHFDCVDVSEKMLAKLAARFADSMVTVTLRHESFLDFEYEARKYDYVVAAATLHHFTDDEKRVLYPRLASVTPGKLVIGDYYVSDAESAQRLVEYRRGIEAGYDFRLGQYHIDIPTSKTNEIDLLTNAGFARVETFWESSNYVILVASA
jgi:tRNA (cmo5U34)-methyltransferase